ncbi:hypothetical protein USB125703_00910 [Pseudoclavibacter triregionum]|nr:hypothetical protein USB125703_00910 [Pseudoclavibacter triregionum]
MARINTWMLSRPHRKLYLVPQTVAALREAIEGEPWAGNREAHLAFEEAIERAGIKAPGERRDRGGSGGRTHVALVTSLGLAFEHAATQRMVLTLAGEALADGAPPAPILRKQVLEFQYPSPYSSRIGIDEGFRLRPFVFLLRLLLDGRLAGELSQEEIALCVITEGRRNDDDCHERVVARILDYRARGREALAEDFAERYGSARGRPDRVEEALSDIANTVLNWLDHTGLTLREPKVVRLADETADEARRIVDELSRKPLIRFERGREENFQRTYGLRPGGSRDNRRLLEARALSREQQVARRVQTALLGISRERIVDALTPALLRDVTQATGFPEAEVEAALSSLIPTPSDALEQFIARYAPMAFSGREEAIEFEIATTEIFERVFGLRADHLGQGRIQPDIIVSTEAYEWVGIIDTKAYRAYELPNDHMLRMRGYAEAEEARGRHADFTAYIAGGFSRTIDARLRTLQERTGVAAGAIGVTAWIELIRRWPQSGVGSEVLYELLSLGREARLSDVFERVPLASDGGEKGAAHSPRAHPA